MPEDGPYVVGHRGTLATHAENTVEGVVAAAPHVDAVEIDVRRCGSGEVVVFHDETLERVCGVDERLADLTLDELREYPVGDSDERVPTLRELLAALPNDVDVNVELKETGLAADVAAAIDDVENDGFVSSFFAQALVESRRADPTLSRALLYTHRTEWDRAVAAAERLGCRYLHPYVDAVTPERVASARAQGFTVNVWEIETESELSRVVDAGVDGVIVDDYRLATAAFPAD
ncbi:glycerophosphodiester phosphodiesterase family protein [Halorubrum gandharaense]